MNFGDTFKSQQLPTICYKHTKDYQGLKDFKKKDTKR